MADMNMGIPLVIMPLIEYGQFTRTECEFLQHYILTQIDNISDSTTNPKFLDCKIVDGSIKIITKNQRTREWLESILDLRRTIMLTPSLSVRVVDLKDVPKLSALGNIFKPKIITIWIEGAELAPDVLLRRVSKQNGIQAYCWNVVSTKSDEIGYQYTICVDPTAWKVIAEKGSVLFCNFTSLEVKEIPAI